MITAEDNFLPESRRSRFNVTSKNFCRLIILVKTTTDGNNIDGDDNDDDDDNDQEWKRRGKKTKAFFLTRNKIGFFPIKDQRPFFLFQPSVAFASGQFLIRARQRFEPTTFQLLSFGSGHHTNLKAFLSIKLPLYGSDWRTIAAVSGIKLSLDFIRRKSIQLSVQQTNKPRQQGSTIKAMYLFLFWWIAVVS